jgi:PAS domain S-box-containing protein
VRPGGRILEVNEALVDLTGPVREELVGTDSLQELVHTDDVGFVREGLERLQSGEVPVMRIEFRMRGLAGQVRWIDFTASIVRGEDGEPLYRISQLQDIDARRRGEEQLRHLADHDTLSGLFNRRRFHEELARELRPAGAARCCCSTSTTSRRSTTRSATRRATR